MCLFTGWASHGRKCNACFSKQSFAVGYFIRNGVTSHAMNWDLEYIDPHRKGKDVTSICKEDIINAFVEINNAVIAFNKLPDSRRCSIGCRAIDAMCDDLQMWKRRWRNIQHEINGKVTSQH